MQIIPVIDLMRGQVVHAKRGVRSQYQALQSTLCASCEPSAVVAALVKLYPFKTIYIADLDAILGLNNHDQIILDICQTYPAINFWLDSGIKQVNARALYFGQSTRQITSKDKGEVKSEECNEATDKLPNQTANIRAVVGSENIANLQDYRAISYACESRHVLSLDYSATSDLGIRELHQSARFWPDDTICMTLHTVGGEQGFDLERLRTIIRLNSTRKTPSNIYAAGGFRDISDLTIISKMGLAGALIATALHNGRLSATDIAHLIAQ